MEFKPHKENHASYLSRFLRRYDEESMKTEFLLSSEDTAFRR